jgi:hypothetical protein
MNMFKKKDTNGCQCDQCCGLGKKIGKLLILLLPMLIVLVALLEMSLLGALIGLAVVVIFYQLQKLQDKIKNCGPWY